MSSERQASQRALVTGAAVTEAIYAPGAEKRAAAVEQVRTLAGEDALASAYAFLQKLVGIVAVLLPFVVPIGDRVIDGHALRGSISAYYYGRTGNYFVGSLCALGVFFLSYQHHPLPGHKSDNIMGYLAGLLAVCVALCPTSSDGRYAMHGSKYVGTVHIACAGSLFALLAVFSLYQFTKTDGEANSVRSFKDKLLRLIRTPTGDLARMTPQKKVRNLVYRTCGWIIVGAIVVILLSNKFHWDLLFWMESLAVVSFGISWLVKGGCFKTLADR